MNGYKKAYKVKMKEDGYITLTGNIISEPQEITIRKGVDYLPVLSSDSVSINNLFGDKLSKIIFIVDIQTLEIYSPSLGDFSTLVYLSPNNAYLIMTTDIINITFSN